MIGAEQPHTRRRVEGPATDRVRQADLRLHRPAVVSEVDESPGTVLTPGRNDSDGGADSGSTRRRRELGQREGRCADQSDRKLEPRIDEAGKILALRLRVGIPCKPTTEGVRRRPSRMMIGTRSDPGLLDAVISRPSTSTTTPFR